jgi:hypothetical protein
MALKQVGPDVEIPETGPRLISAPEPKQAPQKGTVFATGMLLTALSALSQRFAIALVSARNLVIAGSVFWIWLRIIETPSLEQIGSASLYSIFALAVMWIWRG